MNCTVVCYIISIALQVAGALMLIIFSLSTKRKDIIKSFVNSHIIVRDGNTKELSYNHEVFIDSVISAYYSKVSVGYIAAGYIVGIFGDRGDVNRWIVAGITVLITVVLILCTRFTIEKLVKIYRIAPISNEEIESIGAEPDMESMSDEMIDEALSLGGLNFRSKQS